jgi:hypothetical protein
MLAARAIGGAPMESIAAATIKDARGKRVRGFELFIRINWRRYGEVTSMGGIKNIGVMTLFAQPILTVFVLS